MATYDSYKDSGVKWLGQIPSHWEVKNLRANVVHDVNIRIEDPAAKEIKKIEDKPKRKTTAKKTATKKETPKKK